MTQGQTAVPQLHRKRFPCCTEKMMGKNLPHMTENSQNPEALGLRATEETNTFPLIITNFQQSGDVFVISWNQMKTEQRESLQRILGDLKKRIRTSHKLRDFHQLKHGSDAWVTEVGTQVTTSVPGNAAGGTCKGFNIEQRSTFVALC